MKTWLLLPSTVALAGVLSGCVAYTTPGSYAYGSEGYGYGPRYGAPPPVVVQPPPVILAPRPLAPPRPHGRWAPDRDRDGVPDRYDRFPRDPRWR